MRPSANASTLAPQGKEMESAYEDRDLDSERIQLLAKLRELVPPELQDRIREVASAAPQVREFYVKTSHSGAADADPE